MKSVPSSFRHASATVMICGLAALAAGCSGTESDPTPSGEPADPGAGASVGAFILHVQPRLGRISAHRLSAEAVAAQAQHVGPGLSPQVMADVNLQSDDVSGSGPANSVELVTTSTTDTYKSGANGGCPANSFCGDVTLNSFWNRTLNYTYAEITSITDANGKALSGHNATNSDQPPAACQGGCPSSSFGLWGYRSPSVDLSHSTVGNTNVVAPGSANGATRTWVFANPDDADWYAYMRVVASTGYTNYQLANASTSTYMDACTLGSGEAHLNIIDPGTGRTLTPQPVATNSAVYVALPFQFTYYGVSYAAGSRLNFSKWGNATFTTGLASGNAVPSTGNNSALPVTKPSPAVFPFWDNLAWDGTGSPGLCAKQVGSATPNRQVVISWKNVAFSGNGDTGPYITFGLVLNEGSDEIWFNYGSATATGTWSATIGGQDTNGATIAKNSTTVTTYPANTRKILLPLP